MKRKTPLKRKRATPRRSGRVLWPEYLQAVREMPCYGCRWSGGGIDPDHQGIHPYGRKADDDTGVPMCRICHSSRTDGYLWDYADQWYAVGKEEMRKWCDQAIAATQAIVLPLLASRGVRNPKESI